MHGRFARGENGTLLHHAIQPIRRGREKRSERPEIALRATG
jgi:hypothetical protein